MGTRNLTIVMCEGEYIVAQYGQWDGHPTGQGQTAFNFCHKHLSTKEGRQFFQNKLSNVRFMTDQEHKDLLDKLKAPDGFLSMNQAEMYNELAPYLSRDHGADILTMILNSEDGKEALLRNSITFAGESLFCEYAYVIDLDKETFEAYKGFQKTPPPAGERFAEFKPDGDKYYPVALVKSWDLNSLPTYDEFLAAFGQEEDNE